MVRKAFMLGAASLALLGPAAAQPPSPLPSASSTEDARDRRIRELEERVEALAAQIADLKASSAGESQGIRRVQAEAPQVTLNNARSQIASSDGKDRVAIRGVFQFDAAHYDQESPGGVDNRRAGADAAEGPNARDLSSGTNFRRARLGVEGVFAGDWSYALTAELGGSGAEQAQLQQAWVEYAGWKPFGLQNPLRMRVGAFTPPTGLEDATASNDALFVERAAPADLVRSIAGGDGRAGVQLLANGYRWFAGAAITGALIGNTGDFDEQTGAVARVATLLLRGPDYGVHLGANHSAVLEPGDRVVGPGDDGGIRLRERPELRVDGTRLVDTGGLNAEGVDAYGLEVGGQFNGLYLASEYYWIDVDRFAPTSDASFSGWYVQGSWILTGEQREWGPATGGFGAVRPAANLDPGAGSWGAWELTGRYSVLDLNDSEGAAGTTPTANAVRGGEQTITTVGINWFPNPVVRFQLQAQDVSVDRLNPGTVGLAVVGAQIGQDYRTIVLRSQVSF